MEEKKMLEGINVEELINFACKGIRAEIEKEERTIRQGCNYIMKIEAGEKVKTKLTIHEIREVIREAQERIEELDKKRFDYVWELALMGGERK